MGAYTGDTIDSYVRFYGTGYKRIYAYESSEDYCEKMAENTKDFHDIVIRRKGVHNDEEKNTVEVVALDEDITEPVTFIKMDMEGAEADALSGCQNIIEEQHPKLAIRVDHGYNDLWLLPYLINQMQSGYRFYLRCSGADSTPAKIVLLCKDNLKNKI